MYFDSTFFGFLDSFRGSTAAVFLSHRLAPAAHSSGGPATTARRLVRSHPHDLAAFHSGRAITEVGAEDRACDVSHPSYVTPAFSAVVLGTPAVGSSSARQRTT